METEVTEGAGAHRGLATETDRVCEGTSEGVPSGLVREGCAGNFRASAGLRDVLAKHIALLSGWESPY